MRKLLFELLIKMMTGSVTKTERVMEIVYGEPMVGINDAGYALCGNGHYFKKEKGICNFCKKNKIENIGSVENKKSKPNSKKQEILDSLSYLKNKKVKTVKDKDSIYTLEMVLKNMK
jgi:hypothetical protein